MRDVIGRAIRILCLPLALAVAGSFVLAEPLGTKPEWPVLDAPAAHYIVALEDDNPWKRAKVLRQIQSLEGAVYRKYVVALNGGFAATLSADAVQALQRNPYVEFVERDEAIGLAPRQVSKLDAEETAPGTRHSAYCWGADRINQSNLPLDNNTSFAGTGAGRTVYVFGTGIYFDHSLFQHAGGSVAQPFYDAFGQDGNDCYGLGTHAAGVIHSIAENAELRSVRVANCMGTGSTSGFVAGLDHIMANGTSNAVVYAGLFGWGGASLSLDRAFENLDGAGFPVIVAAGNSSDDACNYSPARSTATVTVAATDISDSRTYWSNYGTCVDIFAPGGDITSAWHTSPSDTRTLSGTYAAAAYAAGVWALDPDFVYNATLNIISNVGPGSPNLFVHAD